MAHENTRTIRNPKGKGWVNERTVNKNKPMNPEQKRFFAKVFKTEPEASAATKHRSDRYRVRERQRIKKKK
jgi:hypothetical protein